MVVVRFDVFYVRLDPAVGREIRKTRPCVIISPNEQNRLIDLVIVAPLTSGMKPYRTRINTRFRNKPGQIALEQMRSVSKLRLGRRLGRIESPILQKEILQTLQEMFA